jgi:quercetin dioxygenase-like cupin family protein
MSFPSGITGKVWGQTQSLYIDANCEFHYLSGKKGGYCSKHYHKDKWNRFFIIDGKIKVTIYNENGIQDETILTDGQYTDVEPGVKHRFEVLEDCRCIEIYWKNSLDPHDIVRDDTGGMLDE